MLVRVGSGVVVGGPKSLGGSMGFGCIMGLRPCLCGDSLSDRCGRGDAYRDCFFSHWVKDHATPGFRGFLLAEGSEEGLCCIDPLYLTSPEPTRHEIRKRFIVEPSSEEPIIGIVETSYQGLVF